MAELQDLLEKAAQAARELASEGKKAVKRLSSDPNVVGTAEAAGKLISKVVSLPFRKVPEDGAKNLPEAHPDREKLVVRFLETDGSGGESLRGGGEVLDPENRVIYTFTQPGDFLSSIELKGDSATVGSIRKQMKLLDDPLTHEYRFDVTLWGISAGVLSVRDSESLRVSIRPDFDTWEARSRSLREFLVFDEGDREIASINWQGNGSYLITRTDAVSREMLILALLAAVLRRERMQKADEIDRKIQRVTGTLGRMIGIKK